MDLLPSPLNNGLIACPASLDGIGVFTIAQYYFHSLMMD